MKHAKYKSGCPSHVDSKHLSNCDEAWWYADKRGVDLVSEKSGVSTHIVHIPWTKLLRAHAVEVPDAE